MPRALTVRQPFAAAIVRGEKNVENRTWPTSYRGPLLIHAARAPARGLTESAAGLPRGVILGVVELVDCVRDHSSLWALPGHWHWVLASPRLFPHPFPCRGSLGLWRVVDLCESQGRQYVLKKDLAKYL